jgi:hypothetical protein
MRKRNILFLLALIFMMSCAHSSALNTAKQLDNGFYQALKVAEAKIPDVKVMANTDPMAKKLLPEIVRNYQLAIDANLTLNAALKIWQDTGQRPPDYPQLVVKMFTLLGQIADLGQRAGVDMGSLNDVLSKLVEVQK